MAFAGDRDLRSAGELRSWIGGIPTLNVGPRAPSGSSTTRHGSGDGLTLLQTCSIVGNTGSCDSCGCDKYRYEFVEPRRSSQGAQAVSVQHELLKAAAVCGWRGNCDAAPEKGFNSRGRGTGQYRS